MDAELLILGAGYVGSALARRHPDAVTTHTTPVAGSLCFRLEDPTTWQALPRARHVVCTAALEAQDAVEALFKAHLHTAQQVVVLGTTGAYLPDTAPITEASPTRPMPRVTAEEALRQRGACVLRLAGLWGPGRSPADWLAAGRIAHGGRRVNLVHVDDAVTAIERALAGAWCHGLVNVSDGHPLPWARHVQTLIRAGMLPGDFHLPQGPDQGQRVANHALQRQCLPQPLCLATLTPLATPATSRALEHLGACAVDLQRAAPDPPEDWVAAPSLADAAADALCGIFQAAMDVAAHVAEVEGTAAPATAPDLVDALALRGLLASEHHGALRHAAGLLRAAADGYTGVDVERLALACANVLPALGSLRAALQAWLGAPRQMDAVKPR